VKIITENKALFLFADADIYYERSLTEPIIGLSEDRSEKGYEGRRTVVDEVLTG